MKFSESVRITPRKVKLDEIETYINENPGSTSGEIGYKLGQKNSPMAARLASFKRSGRFQSRKQDGRVRWYPSNYKFSHEITASTTNSHWRCLECSRDFDKQRALTMHKTRVHTEAGKTSHLKRWGKKPQEKISDSDFLVRVNQLIWDHLSHTETDLAIGARTEALIDFSKYLESKE